jgi:N-acetylglutamate synthase-like GNAT family acetyltransferase
MAEIRRISIDDPLYPQECALREQVLLNPIGYDMARFRREFVGLEDKFEHFVAVVRHAAGPRVIGCATLLPNYPAAGVGKLMQMAVDPQRQGEGLGRRLVVAVESRAFGELGLTELFCHAQLPAIGFYDALGWEVDSDEFTEAGIPHRRMRLRAEKPETAPEPSLED